MSYGIATALPSMVLPTRAMGWPFQQAAQRSRRHLIEGGGDGAACAEDELRALDAQHDAGGASAHGEAAVRRHARCAGAGAARPRRTEPAASAEGEDGLWRQACEASALEHHLALLHDVEVVGARGALQHRLPCGEVLPREEGAQPHLGRAGLQPGHVGLQPRCVGLQPRGNEERVRSCTRC